MNYAEWFKENTQHYKGYAITPGGISKDGECRWITFNRLQATKEEVLKNAIEIIDGKENNVDSN